MSITASRLREVLDYSPETGVFIWKISPNGRVEAGSEAGSISAKRYRHISIDGRCYSAHRLAWLYCTGRWPTGWVDHINLDRFDNRISNLREASPSESATHRPSGRSSLKGAYYRPKKKMWEASIMKAGRAHYLGLFPSQKLAHAAYADAARRLHGEFALIGG